ncbi:hypothetical protein CEXT_524511 [Caerostris extrusa]|uniref:Uncharacterized protein n=1 Tax=Caerostris extrusa TaxID=172846 RepID=A0AAV4XPK3_CAEEX|nr:hypothetical protein CEXT_524511 [Caerostris extrusa]
MGNAADEFSLARGDGWNSLSYWKVVNTAQDTVPCHYTAECDHSRREQSTQNVPKLLRHLALNIMGHIAVSMPSSLAFLNHSFFTCFHALNAYHEDVVPLTLAPFSLLVGILNRSRLAVRS